VWTFVHSGCGSGYYRLQSLPFDNVRHFGGAALARASSCRLGDRHVYQLGDGIDVPDRSDGITAN
jgi:hypothetical protein